MRTKDKITCATCGSSEHTGDALPLPLGWSAHMVDFCERHGARPDQLLMATDAGGMKFMDPPPHGLTYIPTHGELLELWEVVRMLSCMGGLRELELRLIVDRLLAKEGIET